MMHKLERKQKTNKTKPEEKVSKKNEENPMKMKKKRETRRLQDKDDEEEGREYEDDGEHSVFELIPYNLSGPTLQRTPKSLSASDFLKCPWPIPSAFPIGPSLQVRKEHPSA